MSFSYLNEGLNGCHHTFADSSTLFYPAQDTFDPQDYLDTDNNPRDVAINSSRAMLMSYESGVYGAGSAVETGNLLAGVIRATVLMHATHTGPLNGGVCCLLSETVLGRDNGVQGYALLLDSIYFGYQVRVVQLTDGLSNSYGNALGSSALLLSQSPGLAFTPGVPVHLELRWAVDWARLRGVRLLARYDPDGEGWRALPEIVWTGASAYVPEAVAGHGFYMVGQTNTGLMYFDDVTVKGLVLS